MPRVASILVVGTAALLSTPIDAGEPQRSSRNSQLSVAVRLVSSCNASVSVESLGSGSNLDRMAQVSCSMEVPYRITVASEPSAESTVDTVGPGADSTAQHTVSIDF